MISRYISAIDPGGASGVPAIIASQSNIQGNSIYYKETENITGAAGAVVTFQVVDYFNNNDAGVLEAIDGSTGYDLTLNTTFSITLDGNFSAQVGKSRHAHPPGELVVK